MFKQTQLEDNNVRLAVTWLRWLVAGFSSRPGSLHVRFEMDKVALEQNFLRVLQFFTVSIIPPWLSTVILSSGDKQQAHWGLQLGYRVSPQRHEQGRTSRVGATQPTQLLNRYTHGLRQLRRFHALILALKVLNIFIMYFTSILE
jgi:hypothetical protein